MFECVCMGVCVRNSAQKRGCVRVVESVCNSAIERKSG